MIPCPCPPVGVYRRANAAPLAKEPLMRSLFCLLILVVPAVSRAGEDGFVPLFNGTDLDGWEVREYQAGDKDKWSVQDGVLTARPGSGWIGTTRMYGDFVLRLEWRIPVNGNSGVFLRV